MIPRILCLLAFFFVGWDIWDLEAFNPFSPFTQEGLAFRLGLTHPAYFLSLLGMIALSFYPRFFPILWSIVVAVTFWPTVGASAIGIGWGAALYGTGLLFMLGNYLARRRFFGEDPLVAGGILLTYLLLLLFVIYPMGTVLISAFEGSQGFSVLSLVEKLRHYGLLWRSFANTLTLAVFVSFWTTLIGVAFAVLVVRSRYQKLSIIWKSFSMLPMITPPFVVGLSLIFLFGRSGFISNTVLGINQNLIIGFPGLALAQIFSFVPLAVMVITAVLKGIDPTIEEASFALGAGEMKTFQKVTWKLLKPGITNAFLLTMIESFADFANPVLIGGDYHVLSTEIFFAVIGKYDNQLASGLSLVLLASTLFFFTIQKLWLGKKSYVTVGGKPQARLLTGLNIHMDRILVAFGTIWSFFTFFLYLFFFMGAFVKLWGIDYSPTLEHFQKFRIDGLESFKDSLVLAFLAAPPTAILGLWIAYITVRQKFWGRGLIEFISLINFAIPGTVVGLGYLLAFNSHPFTMTGTATILIFCFLFRNMAVGLRAGVASLSQIDKSLEESSIMLRANLATTMRRVLFPLLRSTVVTAIAYSFVRAITAISAIVFLVSARWNLATKVILDRIEYGKLGPAAAYCSLLVLLMAVVLVASRWAVKRMAGSRTDLIEVQRG